MSASTHFSWSLLRPPITDALQALAMLPSSDATSSNWSKTSELQGWMFKSPPRLEDTDKEDTLERRIRTAANALRRTFNPIYGGYTNRFFVVDDSELRYYKDEQMRTLAGTIDIATVSEVRPAERSDAPPFSIDLVTDARVFTIAPNPANSEVALTWLGVLASKVETARKRGMFSRSLKHSRSRGKLRKPSSRSGSRRQLTHQALVKSKSTMSTFSTSDSRHTSFYEDGNINPDSSTTPGIGQETVPFIPLENPGFPTAIDFGELFPLVTAELLNYYDASFVQAGLSPLFSTSQALSTGATTTACPTDQRTLSTSLPPATVTPTVTDTLFDPAGRMGQDESASLYHVPHSEPDVYLQDDERAFLAGGKGWLATAQQSKKRIRALSHVRPEVTLLSPQSTSTLGTPSIPSTPVASSTSASTSITTGDSADSLSSSFPKRMRGFFSAAGILTSRRTRSTVPPYVLGLPLLAPLYLSHETCRFAADAPVDVALRELPLTLVAAGSGASSPLLRQWLSHAPRAWLQLLQGHDPSDWLGTFALGTGGDDLGIRWTVASQPESSEGNSGGGDDATDNKATPMFKPVDLNTLESTETYPVPYAVSPATPYTTPGTVPQPGVHTGDIYPLAPKAQFLRDLLYPLFVPMVGSPSSASASTSASPAPLESFPSTPVTPTAGSMPYPSAAEFDKALLTEMSTWDVRLDFLGNLFTPQSANATVNSTATTTTTNPFSMVSLPISKFSDFPSTSPPTYLPGAPLLALLHLLLLDSLSTTDLPGIGGVPPSTQTTLWNTLLRQGGSNQTHLPVTNASDSPTSPTGTPSVSDIGNKTDITPPASHEHTKPSLSTDGHSKGTSTGADTNNISTPGTPGLGTSTSFAKDGSSSSEIRRAERRGGKGAAGTSKGLVKGMGRQQPAVLHSRRRGSSVFVTPDIFSSTPHSYLHAPPTLTPSQKETLFAHSNATRGLRQCYDTQLSKHTRIAVQPFYVDSAEYVHSTLTVGDAWDYQTVVDALAAKPSTTTAHSDPDMKSPIHHTPSVPHTPAASSPHPSHPVKGSGLQTPSTAPRVAFADDVSLASTDLSTGHVHSPAPDTPTSSVTSPIPPSSNFSSQAKKRKSVRYLLSPPNASYHSFAAQYNAQQNSSASLGTISSRKYQLRRRLKSRPLDTLLPRRRTRHISRWEELSGNTPRWTLSVLDPQYMKHTPAFASLLGIGPGQGVPHRRPMYLPPLPKQVYTGMSPLDPMADVVAAMDATSTDVQGRDLEEEYLYNGIWGDKEELLLYRQVQEENLVELWNRRGLGKVKKKKEPKNVTKVDDVHTIGDIDTDDDDDEDEDEDEVDVPDLDIDALEMTGSILAHGADNKRSFLNTKLDSNAPSVFNPLIAAVNNSAASTPVAPGASIDQVPTHSIPDMLRSLFFEAFHPDSTPVHLSFLSSEETQLRILRSLFPNNTPKWIRALRTVYYLHMCTNTNTDDSASKSNIQTSPFAALAQAHYRLMNPSPFRPDALSGLGLRGLEDNLRRALSPLEKCHLGNILISTATEHTIHLLPPVLLLHLLSRRLSINPPVPGTRDSDTIAGSGHGKIGSSAIDFFASAPVEEDPMTALSGHIDAILLAQHSVIRPLVHDATANYCTTVESLALGADSTIMEDPSPLDLVGSGNAPIAAVEAESNSILASKAQVTEDPVSDSRIAPSKDTESNGLGAPVPASDVPQVLPSDRGRRIATLRWLIAQRVSGVLLDTATLNRPDPADTEPMEHTHNTTEPKGLVKDDIEEEDHSGLNHDTVPAGAVDTENMFSDEQSHVSATESVSTVVRSGTNSTAMAHSKTGVKHSANPNTVAYLLRPEELRIFLRASEATQHTSRDTTPLSSDTTGGTNAGFDSKLTQMSTWKTLEALEEHAAKQPKYVYKSPTCYTCATAPLPPPSQQVTHHHMQLPQSQIPPAGSPAPSPSPGSSLSSTRSSTRSSTPAPPGSSSSFAPNIAPAQAVQPNLDHTDSTISGTHSTPSPSCAVGPHGVPVLQHVPVFAETLPRHAVSIHGSHYGLAYEASGSTPPALLAKALRIYVTDFLAKEDASTHAADEPEEPSQTLVTQVSSLECVPSSPVAEDTTESVDVQDTSGSDDVPSSLSVSSGVDTSSSVNSQGARDSVDSHALEKEASTDSTVPTKDLDTQTPQSKAKKQPPLNVLPNTFEDPIILHGHSPSLLVHPATHTHGITEMFPKVVPKVTTVTTVVTTVTTQIRDGGSGHTLPPAHHVHVPAVPDAHHSLDGHTGSGVTSPLSLQTVTVPPVHGGVPDATSGTHVNKDRAVSALEATGDRGTEGPSEVGTMNNPALYDGGVGSTYVSANTTATDMVGSNTSTNADTITTTSKRTIVSTNITSDDGAVIPSDASMDSLPFSTLLSAANSIETRTTTVTTTTSNTVAERNPWANTHTPYPTSFTLDNTPPPLPLPRLSSVLEVSPFSSALLSQADLLIDPYELALAHCKLHVLPPHTTLYRAAHPYGATKLSQYPDVDAPFTRNQSILIVLVGSLRYHFLPPPEILARVGSRAWRILRQQLLLSRILQTLVTKRPLESETPSLLTTPSPSELDPTTSAVPGALPGQDSTGKPLSGANDQSATGGSTNTHDASHETATNALLPRVTFTKHREDRSLVLTQYNLPAPVTLGTKQLLNNEATDGTITTESGCIALEIDRHALQRLKHNVPTLYRHVRMMASLPPPHILVGAIPSLAAVFYDPTPSAPPGLDRLPLMHAVAQAFRPILLSPGERLFSEDDHADCAYVVVSGSIAMSVLPGVGSIAEEEVLLRSERLLAAKALEKRSAGTNKPRTPEFSAHKDDSHPTPRRRPRVRRNKGMSVEEQRLHLARRDEFRVTIATFGPYSCVGESGLFTRTIYKGRRAMLTAPGIDVSNANANVQVTNNLRGYTATATESTLVLRLSRASLYSTLGSTFMLSSRPRVWRQFYEALECRDASTLQRLHSLSSITGNHLPEKYLSPLSDLFRFAVIRAPHTPVYPIVPSSFEVSNTHTMSTVPATTRARTLPSPYPVTYKMENNLKKHQTVFPLNELPETVPTNTTSAIAGSPLRSLMICLRGAVSVETVGEYMQSVEHVRDDAYASVEVSTRNLLRGAGTSVPTMGDINPSTLDTSSSTEFKPKKLERTGPQSRDSNPYYKVYNSGDWIGATLPTATSKTGFLVHKHVQKSSFACIHPKDSPAEDLSDEPLLMLACSSPTARYLKERSKDSSVAEINTSRALAQKIKENAPASAPTLDTPITMVMTGTSTTSSFTSTTGVSTPGNHTPHNTAADAYTRTSETTAVAEIPSLCSDVCTHSAAMLYVPQNALYTFLSTVPNSSHNFKSHLRVYPTVSLGKEYAPVIPKGRGNTRDTRTNNVLQVPPFDPLNYTVNSPSSPSHLQSGGDKNPRIFSRVKRLLGKKGRPEPLSTPPGHLRDKGRRQSFYFGDSTAVKKFTFRSLLPTNQGSSTDAGVRDGTSYGDAENIIIYEQTRLPPGSRPYAKASAKDARGKLPPPRSSEAVTKQLFRE